jgi:hypothetical protein
MDPAVLIAERQEDARRQARSRLWRFCMQGPHDKGNFTLAAIFVEKGQGHLPVVYDVQTPVARTARR